MTAALPVPVNDPARRRPRFVLSLHRRPGWLARRWPGVVLCALVALAAHGLQGLERLVLGRAWLEGLVLAILLGTALRTLWTPGARWRPGIAFSAHTVLEIAVMLMGAAISAATVLAAGPDLLAGVAGLVAAALAVSYGLGRLAGLPPRMATLIACGNSICGNSAIAAVAPVIGADADDVATAIAFTAVLGVGVVLGLPLLAGALHLSPSGFGVFAGLTVYAVPQVLAATAPAGVAAVQIGTLVKLMRVLMLGPVCVALALAGPRPDATGAPGARRTLPPAHHLVPWFIMGFLALAAARSAGLIPAAWTAPSASLSNGLTLVAMAALGLGVDLRMIAAAGPRVIAVVTLSLAALGAIALGLIRVLGLA